MIDIRENVVKYYTNMQLLKQKDVHVFFYNSLYFAYSKYPSITDRVQCRKNLALKKQFFQLFQTFSKKKKKKL